MVVPKEGSPEQQLTANLISLAAKTDSVNAWKMVLVIDDCEKVGHPCCRIWQRPFLCRADNQTRV